MAPEKGVIGFGLESGETGEARHVIEIGVASDVQGSFVGVHDLLSLEGSLLRGSLDQFLIDVDPRERFEGETVLKRGVPRSV